MYYSVLEVRGTWPESGGIVCVCQNGIFLPCALLRIVPFFRVNKSNGCN